MFLTKKKRTLIFWFSFLAFLTLSFFLILYANGLKIDFKDGKIIQSGGIYLRVRPDNASVYLNGKFKGEGTDSLFRRTFFDKLYPKKYSVEVKKSGYFPWQKNLEVKPGMVSSASHIILLPLDLSKNGERVPLQEGVKKIWFLNKRYLLELKEDNSTLNFTLLNLEKKNLFKILSLKKKKDAGSFQVETNKKANLILISPSEKTEYYLIDISEIKNDKIRTFLLPQALPKKINYPLKKIFLLPSQEKLVVAYNKIAFLFDYPSQEEIPIPIKNIERISSLDGSYFVLTNDNIFRTDSSFKEFKAIFSSSTRAQETLNQASSSYLHKSRQKIKQPAPKKLLEKIQDIFPIEASNSLVLLEKDKIYFFDLSKKKITSLVEGKENKEITYKEIKGLFLSPDKEKLAILDKEGIKIVYLSNYFLDYIHKIGEEDLVAEGNYQKISWFPDSMHLFAFNKGKESLSFIEIDPRDNINIFTYKDVKDFFYLPKEDILYLEKGENVFKVDLKKIF